MNPSLKRVIEAEIGSQNPEGMNPGELTKFVENVNTAVSEARKRFVGRG
ncbi:hypothetical protein HOF56_03120 [Candidatus Peribacteria bacterium]|jgi:hypothetical protein|nr:hypothetical protein [Candidatus Peribacteria bacterium]MBT4021024.1 hypothetical protein [Candidatus Peribacteria bacterium]MBT4240922.1 hypothetical protein [Candidatus Peribacteria bacterium]